MSLSEAFLVPFHTLIKLRYTKALDWSSLISGPKAKSSSEVTNLTLFTVSDHYSNHNIMACFKGPCRSAGLWVTAPLLSSGQFSRSVLSDSLVTPWTAACQASLSITNPQSLLKPMSIESVMPSNHLILCHPLHLLPQSSPASGSLPMIQFFESCGQSIGVSASASALPANKESFLFSSQGDNLTLPTCGNKRDEHTPLEGWPFPGRCFARLKTHFSSPLPLPPSSVFWL